MRRSDGINKPLQAGALLALSVFLVAAPCSPVGADSGAASAEGGLYGGAFVGIGRTSGRLVDRDGAANWGNPGWTVDYSRPRFIGGALFGKKFGRGPLPLRVELDGAFGDMFSRSNQLDPQALDETARLKYQWVVTARGGFEASLGPATIFLTAGLAAARVENSVTDLDRSGLNAPWYRDPDDSFHDESTKFGWVLSGGIEALVNETWTLRGEVLHMDFGEDTYQFNHSGNNRCGPGGPHRPCLYDIDNEFGMARLVVIRRFNL